MKLFYRLAIVQGCYYLVTGIWPLLDIESFMVVTGPKCDIWLVKTVGALVIPVALVLLISAKRREPAIQTVVLAVTSAIAFLAIDTVYSLNDTIRDVYLIDAAAQVVFITGWLAFFIANQDKIMTGQKHV